MSGRYPPYRNIGHTLYDPIEQGEMEIKPLKYVWTFARREGFQLHRVRSEDPDDHKAVAEVGDLPVVHVNLGQSWFTSY